MDGTSSKAATTEPVGARGNVTTTDHAPRQPTHRQALAIAEFGRPTLVISKPGTGKTELVALKHTAATTRWGPGAALAVTFTAKAASEVRARLRADRMDGEPGSAGPPEAGTFHSIAARVLAMSTALGFYDGPTVMATADEMAMVLDEARGEPRPPTRPGRGKQTDTLRAALDRAKNAGLMPVGEGYATIGGPVLATVDGLPNPGGPTHDAMVDYQRRLREQRMLDYDDALIQATLMLRQHRTALFPQLKAVIVDEFQDVNDLNMLMIEALSRDLSLTCCGDDDQAIYHWRGARIEHIQRFPEDKPETLVVVLDHDFRSVPGISLIAERIMSGVRGRLPKDREGPTDGAETTPMTIHPYRSRSPGYSPMSHGYEDGLAGHTAEVCRQALGDRAPSDMIALARTNDQATRIRDALQQLGMRSRISNPGALDSIELRSLVAWLRLLIEPAAEGPVRQLAGLPADDGLLRDLATQARREGATLIEWLTIRRRAGKLRSPRLTAVAERHETFKALLGQANDAALVDTVCQAIAEGALSSTDPVRIDHFWRAYAAVLPDLQDGHGLRRAIERLQGSLSEDDLADGTGQVEVSTVHSVKGRQKPLVVISAFADGIMPGKLALAAGMHSPEMDGERRLAYVAVSRAREHVHIVTVAGARSCLASLATAGGTDLGGTPSIPDAAA